MDLVSSSSWPLVRSTSCSRFLYFPESTFLSLHSSSEILFCSLSWQLRVGHATRPVWCLFSSQDQDFKPEHSQTLPSLVILPVTALLTYYNICNRFQKLLVSVYDQFLLYDCDFIPFTPDHRLFRYLFIHFVNYLYYMYVKFRPIRD